VKAGVYDFSADVYSLGLVLYELFENQLPAFDTVRQTVVLPKDFRVRPFTLHLEALISQHLSLFSRLAWS